MGRRDFDRIQKLPVGGMAAGIYVVRSKRSGNKYIEKSFEKRDVRKGNAQIEIAILQKLQGHPGITRLVDVELDDRSGSLYMEYCEIGNLKELINRHRSTDERIPEKLIWHVFSQLSGALAFCHYGVRSASRSLNPTDGWDAVIHRDVKLSNVFLTMHGATSNYPRIVLGDFGLSCSHSMRLSGIVDPYECYAGSPGWEAPEAPLYSRRSDVWNLVGIIQCLILQRPRPDPRRITRTHDDDILSGIVDYVFREGQRPERRPTSIDMVRIVDEGFSRRFLDPRARVEHRRHW